MNYKVFNGMNEKYAKQIANWKYENEYGIYNLPSYEVMLEKKYSLCNPSKAKEYYCFLDEQDNLVAYSRFVNKDNKLVMGIGICPHSVGKGMGSKIIEMSIQEVKKVYPNLEIELEVRSWNERAIKCYLKSGFKVNGVKIINDKDGNLCEFVCMSYENKPKEPCLN